MKDIVFLQALHGMFSEDFMEIYQGLSPKKRKLLLPYLQIIYRRWYHSTLIENIYFSPANITSAVKFFQGTKQDVCLTTQLTQPVSKLSEIDMKLLEYDINSHPIITDLELLVQFCSPSIDLCEEWQFSDGQAQKLAKKLSLQDPFYASFLLEIAGKLNLLDRTPSLYVQRMQTSENAETILSRPPADLFNQIVDATIELCAVGLKESLPVHVPLCTAQGIKDLLINPLHTDGIFEQVLGKLGYDLDMVFDPGTYANIDNPGHDTDSLADIMSGIFVLGITLDRLFFTPFGSFLRVIRPIYSLRFDMKFEIEQFLESYDYEDDFSAFFAPCTSYMLTEFGLAAFGVEATEDNFFDSSKVLPHIVLDDPSLATAAGVRMFINTTRDAIPLSELPDSIYTFRVALSEEPDVWVIIQIPKMTSLHYFYEEIIDIFDLYEGSYSFYHAPVENPFVEYSGKSDKRKPHKKHTEIFLLDLDFEHMKNMLLVVSGDRKFAIEWLEEIAPNPNAHFPVISEVSPKAQKLHPELEANNNDFNFKNFLQNIGLYEDFLDEFDEIGKLENFDDFDDFD